MGATAPPRRSSRRLRSAVHGGLQAAAAVAARLPFEVPPLPPPVGVRLPSPAAPAPTPSASVPSPSPAAGVLPPPAAARVEPPPLAAGLALPPPTAGAPPPAPAAGVLPPPLADGVVLPPAAAGILPPLPSARAPPPPPAAGVPPHTPAIASSTWVALPRPSPTRRGAGVARSRARTNGRGGFTWTEGSREHRTVPPPKPSIAKNNVYNSNIGISERDRPRLAACVAGAMGYLPGKTLCNHSRAQLEAAISYLEAAEPRLAVCIRSWGACSLLSRALSGRQWQLPDTLEHVSVTPIPSLPPSYQARAPSPPVYARPPSTSGRLCSSATPPAGVSPTLSRGMPPLAATALRRAPPLVAAGARHPPPNRLAAPSDPSAYHPATAPPAQGLPLLASPRPDVVTQQLTPSPLAAAASPSVPPPPHGGTPSWAPPPTADATPPSVPPPTDAVERPFTSPQPAVAAPPWALPPPGATTPHWARPRIAEVAAPLTLHPPLAAMPWAPADRQTLAGAAREGGLTATQTTPRRTAASPTDEVGAVSGGAPVAGVPRSEDELFDRLAG